MVSRYIGRPAQLFRITKCTRPARVVYASRLYSSFPTATAVSQTNELFQSALLRGLSKDDYYTRSFRIFKEAQSTLPGQHSLFVHNSSFDLRGFLKSKGYPHSIYEGTSGSFRETQYKEDEEGDGHYLLQDSLQAGTVAFDYNGTPFNVFTADISPRIHIISFNGPDDSRGRDFIKDVFKWEESLKEEVWVYSQGCWTKDKKMYKTIQAAGWEGLVLETSVIDQLKTDTLTFFRSEEVYKALHAPWKRGLILYGPPGNGKTQCIQALLKDVDKVGVGAIYVKSFASQSGDEWSVRSIFEKARKQTPCVLVLEDLDSLLVDSVRSFFLNEMDGLENNDGILTIATTNHPERIDDAILLRPSRFDARFNFGLPTFALRERYCRAWIGKVKALSNASGTLDEAALAKSLASQTAEWSYAFLKELFVSFLLRTASHRSTRDAADKNIALEGLLDQIKLLSVQVTRGRTAGFSD